MEALSEKLYDTLAKIPKSFYLPIGLALIGLIFLIIGLIQLSSSQTVPTTQASNPEIQATESASSLFGLLVVDVEGAVVHPGVYKVATNARIQDALIAAGGLSESADRDTVAKTINMAAKLTDSAKIYIPKTGEVQNATAVLGSQTNLININAATENQLDNLPGIGAVTAQKIIAARPFANVDELLSKKIISSSVYAKIKDSITVY